MNWAQLAKTLAAQEWWEWREGMAFLWSRTNSQSAPWESRIGFGESAAARKCMFESPDDYQMFPDLTDWATIGILIGWVCEIVGHAEFAFCADHDEPENSGEAVARELLTLMNWEET